MQISIDISGQITQKNFDSVIGCKRSDDFKRAVFLSSKTKKEILNKYKGQIIRLIEKIHCILIYYCIKDCLEDVKEIKICNDINYRKLKELLPLLFKDKNYLDNINLVQRGRNELKSNGHSVAVGAFRKRSRSDEVITKEKVEKMLFEFKK